MCFGSVIFMMHTLCYIVYHLYSVRRGLSSCSAPKTLQAQGRGCPTKGASSQARHSTVRSKSKLPNLASNHQQGSTLAKSTRVQCCLHYRLVLYRPHIPWYPNEHSWHPGLRWCMSPAKKGIRFDQGGMLLGQGFWALPGETQFA